MSEQLGKLTSQKGQESALQKLQIQFKLRQQSLIKQNETLKKQKQELNTKNIYLEQENKKLRKQIAQYKQEEDLKLPKKKKIINSNNPIQGNSSLFSNSPNLFSNIFQNKLQNIQTINLLPYNHQNNQQFDQVTQLMNNIFIVLQNIIYEGAEPPLEGDIAQVKEQIEKNHTFKKINYVFNSSCQVLFRKKVSKFKKNKQQLFTDVQVNIQHNQKANLNWIQFKLAQGLNIHVAAGFLIKGQSKITNFGQNKCNVVVSVFVLQDKMKQKNIFKIQFKNEQDAQTFIKEVQKYI